MRLRPVLAALAAAGLASLAWAGAVAPAASATPGAAVRGRGPAGRQARRPGLRRRPSRRLLPWRCGSTPRPTSAGVTPAAATPSGLFPADLQARTSCRADRRRRPDRRHRRRLRRPERRGRPRPSTARQFGLPACTTANGCFRKVNQNGGTTLPAAERRLGRGDLARPRHGLGDLPELPHPAGRGRRSTSFANLGAAVNTAVALGAKCVSNSYGGGETSRRRPATALLQPPGRRDHRAHR